VFFNFFWKFISLQSLKSSEVSNSCCVGSVSSMSSSVLHGRKDLTLSSNAVFTQSSAQHGVVCDTVNCWSLFTVCNSYLLIVVVRHTHWWQADKKLKRSLTYKLFLLCILSLTRNVTCVIIMFSCASVKNRDNNCDKMLKMLMLIDAYANSAFHPCSKYM